ncbi:MAG: hypothetical protein R2751_06825 [Bacteroidales bacterium]
MARSFPQRMEDLELELGMSPDAVDVMIGLRGTDQGARLQMNGSRAGLKP